MAKKIQEIKPEPTFIEQAFAIIDAHYADEDPGDPENSHGMRRLDHKLICLVLNAHEQYIDDKIIEKFMDQIAEHYKPIMRDIAKLQIYASPKWTIIRNLITAAFAIGISLILFFQIINNRLDRIEKRLEEHINKVEQIK